MFDRKKLIQSFSSLMQDAVNNESASAIDILKSLICVTLGFIDHLEGDRKDLLKKYILEIIRMQDEALKPLQEKDTHDHRGEN